jgi:hypothetical protein
MQPVRKPTAPEVTSEAVSASISIPGVRPVVRPPVSAPPIGRPPTSPPPVPVAAQPIISAPKPANKDYPEPDPESQLPPPDYTDPPLDFRPPDPDDGTGGGDLLDRFGTTATYHED